MSIDNVQHTQNTTNVASKYHPISDDRARGEGINQDSSTGVFLLVPVRLYLTSPIFLLLLPVLMGKDPARQVSNVAYASSAYIRSCGDVA